MYKAKCNLSVDGKFFEKEKSYTREDVEGVDLSNFQEYDEDGAAVISLDADDAAAEAEVKAEATDEKTEATTTDEGSTEEKKEDGAAVNTDADALE